MSAIIWSVCATINSNILTSFHSVREYLVPDMHPDYVFYLLMCIPLLNAETSSLKFYSLISFHVITQFSGTYNIVGIAVSTWNFVWVYCFLFQRTFIHIAPQIEKLDKFRVLSLLWEMMSFHWQRKWHYHSVAAQRSVIFDPVSYTHLDVYKRQHFRLHSLYNKTSQ